ncbi:MAG TPA: mechanosensitive ion channel domain-containing protein [Burkholderiales bacterium]
MSFSLQYLTLFLREDLHNPVMLWQAGTLAVCLLLAAYGARLLRRGIRLRMEREAQAQAAGGVPASVLRERSLRVGREGVMRLAFPLLALAFLLVGRGLLEHYPHLNATHLHLVHLAVPLLYAMAGIRAIVYLLRHVFHESAALKAGERWIAFAVWLAVAIDLVGLTPDIVALLESISFHLGKQSINLWLIGQAVFSVALTLLVSLWASALLEQRLMAAETLDMSFRVAVGRFARALFVTVAVLVSMSLVGIDLTVLSVFGGALGVGLGLGLQRIASNYMSGFIILLDHSIRIGDVVTVDKFSGAVTHINTRYTVLKGLDGTESILPNEMLVSTPVVNQSYTSRKVALSVQLSVAYDSDLDMVGKLLETTAAAHPRVLADPPPRMQLSGFGADGLELSLGFWIEDPERGNNNVRSEINLAIWREFKARGVEIPYPQREVRVLNLGDVASQQQGTASANDIGKSPTRDENGVKG